MEFNSINLKDKFDEDRRGKSTMTKEVSSSQEDFELYYEKSLGVNFFNNLFF